MPILRDPPWTAPAPAKLSAQECRAAVLAGAASIVTSLAPGVARISLPRRDARLSRERIEETFRLCARSQLLGLASSVVGYGLAALLMTLGYPWAAFAFAVCGTAPVTFAVLKSDGIPPI